MLATKATYISNVIATPHTDTAIGVRQFDTGVELVTDYPSGEITAIRFTLAQAEEFLNQLMSVVDGARAAELEMELQ